MIEVPQEFRPKIGVVYPAENYQIFEEWYAEQTIPETERIYLPVFFTSYYVNNSYGQDKESLLRLWNFLETLDKTKKYYTIIQYDDGSMIDWDGLGIDMLEFNMSKKKGIEIPLLCMPHSYRSIMPSNFNESYRPIFMSFIGSRTHPIRDNVLKIEDWLSVITDKSHSIDDYCDILSKSKFGLCPRGYGLNSFRIMECMQYGAIPVYISDEFIEPFGINFNEYGIKINPDEVFAIPEILKSFTNYELDKKTKRMKELYHILCTYSGVFSKIIETLKNECRD